MSPEQNKDIVRGFYDNLNRKNLNVIDDLLTSDFIEHEQLPTPGKGREAVRQFFNMFSSAFPDARFNVEEMYTDGDTVIARFKVRGNHHGMPIRPGDPSGQLEAGERIRAWLAEKGFAK